MHFLDKCIIKNFGVFISDLEWKLIYVGSAEDENYDQQLESVLVGPVNVGTYRFVLQVIYVVLLYSTLKQSPYIIDPEIWWNKARALLVICFLY